MGHVRLPTTQRGLEGGPQPSTQVRDPAFPNHGTGRLSTWHLVPRLAMVTRPVRPLPATLTGVPCSCLDAFAMRRSKGMRNGFLPPCVMTTMRRRFSAN